MMAKQQLVVDSPFPDPSIVRIYLYKLRFTWHLLTSHVWIFGLFEFDFDFDFILITHICKSIGNSIDVRID